MTPAITLIKKLKLAYELHEYTHDASADSYGLEAAEKLSVSVDRVFKTLVVSDEKKNLAVAVLPVSQQLNLKKMAKAIKAKKVSMAEPTLVEKTTGYVLGGVSPLGQKKRLKTVIDATAMSQETIYISAGKRGLEIELTANDLANALNAQLLEIT